MLVIYEILIQFNFSDIHDSEIVVNNNTFVKSYQKYIFVLLGKNTIIKVFVLLSLKKIIINIKRYIHST